MHVEAVLIGTELLSGELTDKHAARLGDLLRTWGFRLSRAVVVADDPGDIAAAIREGTSRSDLLVVTGGRLPKT